jgi:hypothetical protein
MISTITGIIAAAVLIGSAFLFPWLQKKGIVTFGPRSYTLIVPGTREELLQRSCDALDAARHFSITEVSDRDFEVKARYRVLPLVSADLTVALLPQDTDSTAVRATISVLPNLFTVVTVPERRIFARFTSAMRKEVPCRRSGRHPYRSLRTRYPRGNRVPLGVTSTAMTSSAARAGPGAGGVPDPEYELRSH